MKQTLKVAIPMAGLGTRLRPHTWSKPKQLISVAGKAVLDHVLSTLESIPDSFQVELINIVGYLGDQIENYVRQNYPDTPSHFVVQENPRGQSHAIHLAREHIKGPLLIVFADTLIGTDLSFLETETADAVAWVRSVEDPRRFGVAEVGDNGWVTRLVEKPQQMDNNLAVVGFYYFRRGEDLLAAIEHQMESKIQLKGEYYLADAINILIDQGMQMRTEEVSVWLDAGTSEALLNTNRYLLDNGRNNERQVAPSDHSVIIPPVYIHPTAEIKYAIIGPYVSLGAGCQVTNSIIRDSILEDEAISEGAILEGSLIGRKAQICRRPGVINAGDQTHVTL